MLWGRSSGRSLFLGDPGAIFFCGKLGTGTKKEKRSKKERKQRPVETDAADGNPQRTRIPTGLESTKRFPQFPQGPTAVPKRDLIHQQGGAKSKDQKGPNQVDESSHRLARGSIQQNRVLVLWGDPHPTARPVLLKVALVQAPQLNVGAPGQATKFFLPWQLSADQLERPGGAVCGAESPCGGTTFDIAVPLGARRSVDADARTAPAHPIAWPVC